MPPSQAPELLEKRLRSLEALREFHQQVLQRVRAYGISPGADPPSLLRELGGFIQSRLDLYSVLFLLRSDTADELVEVAAAGAHEKLQPPEAPLRVPFGTGIIGWAAQSGRTLVANDVTREPRFIRGRLVETAAELAVPLLAEGKAAGVVDFQDRRVNRFSREVVALIEDIVFTLGVVLENSRLTEALQTQTVDLRRMVQDKLVALQASEARYRSLFENARDPIFTLDLAGKFTSVNKAAEALTGYRRSEFLDRSFETVVAAESLRCAGDSLQLLRAGKDVITGELDIITRTGEHRTLEISASPIWEGGRVTGVEGLARDVSERKRLTERLAEHTRVLEEKVRERTREVEQTRDAAMLAIAKLAESIDTDTEGHIERVRSYSRILARELRSQDRYRDLLTDDYVELIYGLSPLHDLGKVGIRDDILLKPGRLTPEEFRDMERHTMIGADALHAAGERLRRDPIFSLAEMIARYHHEKWDGTGYPAVRINGEVRPLRGEEIPLCARIVAVADVYDALTSLRPYKPAYPHEHAKALIVEGAGKHFDPDLVQAFLRREEEFLSVQMRYRPPGQGPAAPAPAGGRGEAGASVRNA